MIFSCRVSFDKKAGVHPLFFASLTLALDVCSLREIGVS